MGFKRVLLFGAGGQLGSAFRESWTGPCALIAVDRAGADLSQSGVAAALIAAEQPDAVINAAAYTAVDRADCRYRRKPDDQSRARSRRC